MAAKQMEEIQRKLTLLSYPRANASSQSLLFAGMERYSLLEWLFFKLLGDKSPFSQQNLQGDGLDRDEETSRIQFSFNTCRRCQAIRRQLLDYYYMLEMNHIYILVVIVMYLGI
ncbi:putative HAUS augmin-like complex subunit 7 [Helianthus annuus]|nr:putative HAUS augmin-like complex subunit 7 [Helianthus annuus]